MKTKNSDYNLRCDMCRRIGSYNPVGLKVILHTYSSRYHLLFRCHSCWFLNTKWIDTDSADQVIGSGARSLGSLVLPEQQKNSTGEITDNYIDWFIDDLETVEFPVEVLEREMGIA